MDLEAKVRLLTGADFWALHPEPSVGLRRLVTSDGPAGVRGERWDERDEAANVPSPTMLAATWDEERIERLGRLLASECRRKGVDVLLAPTVNLHRSPYGGRHFECFSEDPLLTARIGAAYVRGLQEEGVAATVKHFVANDSETERFTYEARVSDRALRELYLAPFEEIVREAGAWAVMAAYNAVNGPTMTESPLLREILREEWGFDGVVMSDWSATRDTDGAGRAALDLAMPGPSSPWGDALVAAVREGRVPEAEIDEKVERILRLADRVGARGEGGGEGEGDGARTARPWSPEEIAAELRATAAAGIVLTRNEDAVLPLDRATLKRVAVLGPNAAVARTLGGGSATVFPPYTISPLDGLREALPDAEVAHAPGVRAHTRLPAAALLDGVETSFLAADGTVLATEHRDAPSFHWMIRFTPELDIADVAAVELRGRIRADAAGEYVLGCSGVGRHRLAVDGEELFDVDIALPPGADHADTVLAPPQHGAPVPLEAGQEVELTLRREVDRTATNCAVGLNAETPWPDEDAKIEAAVELAAGSDVAIVVVGTTEEVEREGVDRDSLDLPGRQDELVSRVAAANPRTIVVVNAGAPVLLPWAGDVPAVLLAWFGGQELGHALADVLTGASEPGGRLPTTWPATTDALPSTRPDNGVLEYAEDIRIGYRDEARAASALYPFGHGLGYGTWEYDERAEPTGRTAVSVTLRNAGDRRAREVVQVYASRADSAIERPAQWLVGFRAAELDPGETATVTVPLAPRAFAHWDGDGWAVEAGTFALAAGRSSRDLRAHAEVTVDASRL
jgi:beta-glucosidase